MTHTPFEEIFATLQHAQVRYILVGGLATVLHGHLRTTADVDLVVALDPNNLSAAIQALQELDFRPRPPVPFEDFADAMKRQQWVDEKGLTVFSTYTPKIPGIEVDLFVQEPFDFDAVHARTVRVALDTCDVVVIGIDDLIAMKEKAGRPLDLDDARALGEIRDRRQA